MAGPLAGAVGCLRDSGAGLVLRKGSACGVPGGLAFWATAIEPLVARLRTAAIHAWRAGNRKGGGDDGPVHGIADGLALRPTTVATVTVSLRAAAVHAWSGGARVEGGVADTRGGAGVGPVFGEGSVGRMVGVPVGLDLEARPPPLLCPHQPEDERPLSPGAAIFGVPPDDVTGERQEQ